MTKAIKVFKNKPIIPLGNFLAVTVVLIVVSFAVLNIPIGGNLFDRHFGSAAQRTFKPDPALGTWAPCDRTDRGRIYLWQSRFYGTHGNRICTGSGIFISLDI